MSQRRMQIGVVDKGFNSSCRAEESGIEGEEGGGGVNFLSMSPSLISYLEINFKAHRRSTLKRAKRLTQSDLSDFVYQPGNLFLGGLVENGASNSRFRRLQPPASFEAGSPQSLHSSPEKRNKEIIPFVTEEIPKPYMGI